MSTPISNDVPFWVQWSPMVVYFLVQCRRCCILFGTVQTKLSLFGYKASSAVTFRVQCRRRCILFGTMQTKLSLFGTRLVSAVTFLVQCRRRCILFGTMQTKLSLFGYKASSCLEGTILYLLGSAQMVTHRKSF